MEQSLNTLQEGQSGRITSLHTGAAVKRRLLDFGLMEGTEIRCLRRGPAGSPVLYLVRGTMLALRNTDSAGIFVKRCRS